MENVNPTDEKCPSCKGRGQVHHNDVLANEMHICLRCEGTGRRTRNPTADSRQGDSERSAVGREAAEVRSTSAEEARALTGGLVKLKRRFAEMISEAWLNIDLAEEEGLDAVERGKRESRKDTLVECLMELESETEISPAVSRDRCSPGPSSKDGP